MEQVQKAILTLKTIDAASYNYNTLLVWKNINLPLLLGDMYDKYDNFNLNLIEIACDDDRIYDPTANTYTITAGSDDSDRIFTLNLSGLNFLNATYDSYTNNNSSSVVIGTYHLYETFSKGYHNNSVTFTKGSDRATLTIEYKTILDNSAPSTLSYYPQMVFLFTIYGIPKVIKN